MKKTISACIVLTMIVMLTGCGKSEPQTMTLSLDSNPTTGYTWMVDQDKELFDVSEEYVENDHEEGMVGVGGVQTFTLTPKEAGTCELTFTYRRSWEDPSEEDTVVGYTVEVSKSMQIEVTASRYAGGDDINTVPQIPEPTIE
jgi:predicted secreted protein